MEKKPHILVVDDHREIRDALKKYLERHGFNASVASDGISMDALFKAEEFDLVILDVMMPGEDGLAICRRLRVAGNVPILMLTALGEETDRIVGLEIGADDYLAKPFSPREVIARIKAILRRTQAPVSMGRELAGTSVFFGDWELDIDRRALFRPDKESVALTTADFRLLLAFVQRPRIVLSRDRLLDLTNSRVAGPFDRAIDNQVSRLRRKLEVDPAAPTMIVTVRGGGYCFSVDVIERR